MRFMHNLGSKSAFGLLEVIIASLVLAFMLIGFNILQKGNRESILRIRARDAANVIAQEMIDSISALGAASVQAGVYDLSKTRVFTGSVTRKLQDTMSVEMPYSIVVNVRDASQLDGSVVEEQTDYMIAAGISNNISVRHQFAKQVDITVNWAFKNSSQSINMSSIIR
jgi:Tfp pilus assembly protein PilV